MPLVMLKPLQWPLLSWVWLFTSNLSRYVFWPLGRLISAISSRGDGVTGRYKGDEEEGSHLSNDPPPTNTSQTVITRRAIQRPSNQKLLIIGIFAEVYFLDENIIRKVPRSKSEEDMQPIIREATIYDMIGIHPRIAECMSRGRTDYVDVQYYPYGDLVSYSQRTRITPELQSKWFQQILEAIVLIHSHSVIHSDLALRQFFVDNNLDLRLGDFNSSQYPGHPALGYEKAAHCLPRDSELPNTEQSDIFALGSTLYELVVGKAPYSDLNPIDSNSNNPDVIKARIHRQPQTDIEIELLYKHHNFPDVSGVFRGDVILGCWRGDLSTAKEALHLYADG